MTISKTKTVKEVVSSIDIETPLHIKYGTAYLKIVEGVYLWVYDDGETMSITGLFFISSANGKNE